VIFCRSIKGAEVGPGVEKESFKFDMEVEDESVILGGKHPLQITSMSFDSALARSNFHQSAELTYNFGIRKALILYPAFSGGLSTYQLSVFRVPM